MGVKIETIDDTDTKSAILESKQPEKDSQAETEKLSAGERPRTSSLDDAKPGEDSSVKEESFKAMEGQVGDHQDVVKEDTTSKQPNDDEATAQEDDFVDGSNSSTATNQVEMIPTEESKPIESDYKQESPSIVSKKQDDHTQKVNEVEHDESSSDFKKGFKLSSFSDVVSCLVSAREEDPEGAISPVARVIEAEAEKLDPESAEAKGLEEIKKFMKKKTLTPEPAKPEEKDTPVLLKKFSGSAIKALEAQRRGNIQKKSKDNQIARPAKKKQTTDGSADKRSMFPWRREEEKKQEPEKTEKGNFLANLKSTYVPVTSPPPEVSEATEEVEEEKEEDKQTEQAPLLKAEELFSVFSPDKFFKQTEEDVKIIETVEAAPPPKPKTPTSGFGFGNVVMVAMAENQTFSKPKKTRSRKKSRENKLKSGIKQLLSSSESNISEGEQKRNQQTEELKEKDLLKLKKTMLRKSTPTEEESLFVVKRTETPSFAMIKLKSRVEEEEQTANKQHQTEEETAEWKAVKLRKRTENDADTESAKQKEGANVEFKNIKLRSSYIPFITTPDPFDAEENGQIIEEVEEPQKKSMAEDIFALLEESQKTGLLSSEDNDGNDTIVEEKDNDTVVEEDKDDSVFKPNEEVTPPSISNDAKKVVLVAPTLSPPKTTDSDAKKSKSASGVSTEELSDTCHVPNRRQKFLSPSVAAMTAPCEDSNEEDTKEVRLQRRMEMLRANFKKHRSDSSESGDSTIPPSEKQTLREQRKTSVRQARERVKNYLNLSASQEDLSMKRPNSRFARRRKVSDGEISDKDHVPTEEELKLAKQLKIERRRERLIRKVSDQSSDNDGIDHDLLSARLLEVDDVSIERIYTAVLEKGHFRDESVTSPSVLHILNEVIIEETRADSRLVEGDGKLEEVLLGAKQMRFKDGKICDASFSSSSESILAENIAELRSSSKSKIVAEDGTIEQGVLKGKEPKSDGGKCKAEITSPSVENLLAEDIVEVHTASKSPVLSAVGEVEEVVQNSKHFEKMKSTNIHTAELEPIGSTTKIELTTVVTPKDSIQSLTPEPQTDTIADLSSIISKPGQRTDIVRLIRARHYRTSFSDSELLNQRFTNAEEFDKRDTKQAKQRNKERNEARKILMDTKQKQIQHWREQIEKRKKDKEVADALLLAQKERNVEAEMANLWKQKLDQRRKEKEEEMLAEKSDDFIEVGEEKKDEEKEIKFFENEKTTVKKDETDRSQKD